MEESIYKCPICKKGFIGKEWDEFNMTFLKNREARRSYISITKERKSHNGDLYYICPNCKKGIYNTKIVKTNKSTKK